MVQNPEQGEVQFLGQGWRRGGGVGFLLGTAASIVHVLCKADLCSGQRWWIEASVHPNGQQTLKDSGRHDEDVSGLNLGPKKLVTLREVLGRQDNNLKH